METLKWTTMHNTAEKTMSHVFEHGRIMMLTDMNTGQAYVQKDGVALYALSVESMTLDEYTQELEHLAREDARLGQFSKG